MKDDKQALEDLFSRFDGQWDTEEPTAGHEDRFLDRLENNKRRKKGKGLLFRLAMPTAAAILIIIGFWTVYKPDTQSDAGLAKMSPKVQETQMYFSSIIQKELAKVEKETSPETRVLVKDALERIDALEKDYEKLTKELLTKGENKQIIHAMITNLQTRISFLEDVLTKIENIKKLKETYHENNNV